ncbi:4Fe-4S binding protein, partial [bacterium]|nr:4Fe-4S binding protein [bacterium]
MKRISIDSELCTGCGLCVGDVLATPSSSRTAARGSIFVYAISAAV